MRPRYTVIDKVQCVQSPDDPSSEGALTHAATPWMRLDE